LKRWSVIWKKASLSQIPGLL